MLASLPIAGCSLAVSVVAGIAERRRAFSLLRLSGTPLRVLRRVIALESAVPLLVLAALSIATGFLAAGLFLHSQLGERFTLTASRVLSHGCAGAAGIVAATSAFFTDGKRDLRSIPS